MPTPVFQPYMPKQGESMEERLKNLTNAYIESIQYLQWIMQHLTSDNVKKLLTEQCKIKSANGETEFAGPLLVMKDKQTTPVLRLQAGYDKDTSEFTFKLMDIDGNTTFSVNSLGHLLLSGRPLIEIYDDQGPPVLRRKTGWNGSTLVDEWYDPTGNLTAYVDTNGKLIVISGEFKGTIDIGDGNFTVDADGTVRVKTTMVIGDELYLGTEAVDKAIHMGLSFLQCIFSGGKYNLHMFSNGYFNILSDGDMQIFSGTAVYPKNDWDCTDAAFAYLNNGSSSYATQSWVTSQGYITGVSGASGTFTTVDGKTVTVSGGLITDIT